VTQIVEVQVFDLEFIACPGESRTDRLVVRGKDAQSVSGATFLSAVATEVLERFSDAANNKPGLAS